MISRPGTRRWFSLKKHLFEPEIITGEAQNAYEQEERPKAPSESVFSLDCGVNWGKSALGTLPLSLPIKEDIFLSNGLFSLAVLRCVECIGKSVWGVKASVF